MDKNQILFDKLASLFRTHIIWYSSETDSGLEAVRLPWYRVMRWQQEKDKVAEERIAYHVTEHGGPGWKAIDDAMKGQRLVSIKRPFKGETSRFELYILANFGWWYVGFKTILVET